MPNPRTLDNPNDIAIREQQARQRLEMGRNRDTRQTETQPPIEYSEPFTFRFRQIKNGSFSGLWELAALRPNGRVDEIISDADNLSNVLDMIGNIFDNKGY